jgi:N-acetylglutamate synthase-like GNAT family acetyltransferase
MKYHLSAGYRPGAIGRITELHGKYYSEQWGFDLFFEAKVATELSAFLNVFDETRDGFWLALNGERVIGSIAVVSQDTEKKVARLRWFIVDQEFLGLKLGNCLMWEAVEFCKKMPFQRVFLTTFDGLDKARHLYEKFGFRLCSQQEDAHWGKKTIEQEFELLI